MNKKRDSIKFEDGIAVKVTFDYEPSTAKSFEQDSKFSDTGKQTRYAVSVNNSEIIFASEALYERLRMYNKDDTVNVMLENRMWIVTPVSGSAEMPRIGAVDNDLLPKIYADTQEIKNILKGKDNGETDKETTDYPGDKDISF